MVFEYLSTRLYSCSKIWFKYLLKIIIVLMQIKICFKYREYYIQINPKYILNSCDYFVLFLFCLFVCLFAFFVKYIKIPQIEVKYFLNHWIHFNYSQTVSKYCWFGKGLVKKYRDGWAGAERGWVMKFWALSGGGSPYLLLTTNETVDYTCYIKHSQLELLQKYSQTCCARKYKG